MINFTFALLRTRLIFHGHRKLIQKLIEMYGPEVNRIDGPCRPKEMFPSV